MSFNNKILGAYRHTYAYCSDFSISILNIQVWITFALRNDSMNRAYLDISLDTGKERADHLC